MNSDDGKHEHPPVATLEPNQPMPASPPARPAPDVSPTRKPVTRRHPLPEFEEDEGPKGFARYRLPLFIGLLTLGAIVGAQRILSNSSGGPAPKQEMQMVNIAMPPPPPPPPPPPQPPEAAKEEKMVEEEKLDEAPDTTPQIQTAASAGKGPGIAGLGRGNGNGLPVNRNAVNAEKMRWSAYASSAQAQIVNAMRTNARTKKATMRIEVRIWPDASGRIGRATVSGSSGDPAVDAAVRDEILTGMQLSQPPPDGMPTPIVIRVTARRPN